MSEVLIPLTVWKKGPAEYLDPVTGGSSNVSLEYIPGDAIAEVTSTPYGAQIKVKKGGVIHEYQVFETPSQVKASENPSTSNPHAQHEITIGADAAGSTQGNGVDITTYLTTIDAATDTSAEAFDLPAATLYDVRVLINETAVALEGFPASTENFRGEAANAVLDIPAKSKAVFYCIEEGVWDYILVP